MVETSLGYFINPLVTVVLGVVVLREGLGRRQWVAIAIAATAVIVLTVASGRPPWIALTLAFAFGVYGLVKKKVGIGSIEGLSVETAMVFPLAFAYLIVLERNGTAAFGHSGWADTLVLACAGLITAIPLLLFGSAVTRIPLTTLGPLQYIAPSIQFLLGVLVLGEPLSTLRLIGFALVWLALAILTADVLLRRRARLGQRDGQLSVSRPGRPRVRRRRFPSRAP